MVAPGLLGDPLEQPLVRLVLLGRPEDARQPVDVGHVVEEAHGHLHALDERQGVLVRLGLVEALV